jgi:phage terminase large subunit-like protein
VRAGPKREVTAPRLDISRLPRQRAARCIRFVEGYLRVPKGVGARRRAKLRPWQRAIIRGALAPGVRQGLLTMPRGNGKTTLAAFLATYGLFADNVEGAQVLTVASDHRQAAIIFNTCRRMIELDARLADRVQVFSDRIYVPHTDSTLTALPADPDALQGWDPSLCIVDELHVVREEVYDAMALAGGKRDRSIVLAISTAADSKDSVMWRLVEHGRTGDDPAFFYSEFSAPEGCDADDEEAWAIANPALGDFLAIDALRATYRTTREEVFRRYRLNQWLAQVGSWLPWEAWETCAVPERVIDPDEPVVLGFDGSISDDSTALIGCTVARPHHVFAVSVFERDDERWRVPRADVDAAVARAFESLNVVELAADPWHWHSEIQSWRDRFERVIEWPTNAIPRMAPATDRLRTAVMEHTVTHDGNEALARHVRNAVVKSTALGDVIIKDRRGSPRKIDAAVAAIVAHDRAAFHASKPQRRRRMVVVP